MDEAALIYYGLQHLAAASDDLGPEKLFTVRAACIPPENWTYAIWREAARVVSVYSKQVTVAIGTSPSTSELVQEMVGQAPVEQGLFDARISTPRPSPQQIETVRAIAQQLRLGRGPQRDTPVSTAEIERIETERQWSTALEIASSCTHPDGYPAKLAAALHEMHPKGITWRNAILP